MLRKIQVAILPFIISLSALILFSPPMNSTTAIKTMVERQANAWETQDVSSLIGDFAPDAVFKAGSFTFKGIDAIQNAAESYFRQFKDTKVTIKRIIVEDRQGAVEWDWSERNRKTNAPSAAEDAIVFELGDDGKIVYWREYIEKVKVKK